MGIVVKLHRAIDKVLRAPGIRRIADIDAKRRFRNNRREQLFYGVYSSWSEADAAAASFGVAGYDNTASTDLYTSRTTIQASDYPALYWLRQSMELGARTVFDVGGNVGIKYFAFKSELSGFEGMRWRVMDVPAVIARGRQLAERRGETSVLDYTSGFQDGDGFDIVYASGSLQFIPETLDTMLGRYSKLPATLVLTGVPLHESSSYYTINSIGTAFCPYRIQTKEELIGPLEAMGYKLKHSWENLAKKVHIPHDPQRDVDSYSGFLLVRSFWCSTLLPWFASFEGVVTALA